MKLCYVAGPYRSKTEYGIWQNIEAARVVAVEVLRAGYFPLTPHLNSCFLGGVVPDRVVLGGYLEVLRACPAIVMMTRWKESRGARAEHALALKLDKLVVYEADEDWLRRLSMTA